MERIFLLIDKSSGKLADYCKADTERQAKNIFMARFSDLNLFNEHDVIEGDDSDIA